MSQELGNRVEIDVWSCQDYERLVAEITLDGEYIGLLSQEVPDGPIYFELDFKRREAGFKIDIRLLDEILRSGRERLEQLDKPRSKPAT